MYLFIFLKFFSCLLFINFVFSLECPYDVDCNQVPGWSDAIKGECTEQNEKLPDPEDCRRYYLCYSDNDPNPELKFCNQDMVFDSIIKDCIPWCQKPNDTITTTTTEIPTEKPPEEPPSICSSVGNKYYNKYFCYKYYECLTVGKAPVIRNCSSNTQFDPELEYCVAPMCDYPKPPEICEEYNKYPDYLDCRSYYNCQSLGYSPVHVTCPQPGQWFNPDILNCAKGDC